MSQEQQKHSRFSLQKGLWEFFVFLFTLPWLVLVSGWIFISGTTLILNTEPAIRLQESIAADFSGYFTYVSAWLWVTAFIFCGALANFIWFRENRTFQSVSILVLLLLVGSYFLILAPEISLYLKLRNLT